MKKNIISLCFLFISQISFAQGGLVGNFKINDVVHHLDLNKKVVEVELEDRVCDGDIHVKSVSNLEWPQDFLRARVFTFDFLSSEHESCKDLWKQIIANDYSFYYALVGETVHAQMMTKKSQGFLVPVEIKK